MLRTVLESAFPTTRGTEEGIDQMTQSNVSRRTVFKGAGAAAILASGGGALAGCGSKKAKNTTAKNEKVKLPNTIAQTGGPKPDLPGTSTGVQPAFFRYPANPLEVSKGKPGNGGSVSVMANIYYAIPKSPPANKFWTQLNSKLGVDLKLQMVPNGDYNTKFPTVIAGNDLPDILQMVLQPNYQQLLSSKFTDLSEHLAGDAVKDYPNLSHIQPTTWKSTVFNGGIYGVPVPRALVGTYNFVREDLYEKAGASINPKTFEEFHENSKALTDKSKKQWTFASAYAVSGIVQTMLNAPNGWKLEGGKLTNINETDEYRKAISAAAQFWKEGLIHPDAFQPSVPTKVWFVAGTICCDPTGYAGWAQYRQQGDPKTGFKLNLLTVPGYDGGLGKIPLGNGSYAMISLKKADKKRIQELLRILDWMAAPFGSAEYLFRLYGVEGVDFKRVGGEPQLTPTGLSETTIPIRYIADCPPVIYEPGTPADDKVEHDYQMKVVPQGIQNPTLGLFSDANATKGATIGKNFTSATDDIIQGRKPLSALDDAIKAWKSGGGDEMRHDYEEQLQKQGGK